MLKRFCDVCKREIGFMRARYELKTIWPVGKEPTTEDLCYACYSKARARMNKKGDVEP